MAERVQDYDLVRASINQAQTGIPGIRLPEDVPLLGHGAQGWVFYAEETGGTPRALKVQKAAEGMPPKDAERAAQAFENEGTWLKAFDHPNIVKVFRTGVHQRTITAENENAGIEQVKDYQYMLMEFAGHGSVADRIKSIGTLPVEEAVLCILHATEGMRYAHAEKGVNPANKVHGLTHGDLNPRNLVIAAAGDRQRVVKVGDFGIARGAHSSEDTMTSTQYPAFSLPYASERQITTGNVFYADDIYSLGGVTAYELLAGRRPIEPNNKTIVGYATAHGSSKVSPMERTYAGKIDQVVEALNEPVLTALLRNPNDPQRKYTAMGEYQAAFKEALAHGTAEAAKDKTIIILGGHKKTLPLTADQLLEAELPPDPETEILASPPGDTHLLKNAAGSRRKFLLMTGGLVVGAATGGVLWANNRGESPAERTARVKLEKERTAITGFAYKVIDFLGQHEGQADKVSLLLQQVVPYDPKGIVPRIEQMQNSTDYYAAAWLGACLVRYNQPDAQKIMQGFLDQKKYREAAIIATQLASYAQSPNGNSDWLTEVEKVRTTLVASTDATYTARQDYDTILGVVPDLTSAAAANTLEQLGNGHNYGAIQSLGWALAPHNTAAVNTELLRGIDQANLAKDNSADSDREIKYSLVGELGRALTPYAVEVVAESMKHIDDSGVNSGQANDAQQRIATGFVPYKPDATVAYIKDGSEDPAKWQTHRWNMTTLVALGQTDPAFVASMRQNITSSPYVEWIDASLDPLLHLSEAETVLPTFKGIYLSDAAHLLDALLRSRQPKAQ